MGTAGTRRQENVTAQCIREVMTADPVTMAATETVADATRKMRDGNIDDVIVLDNGQVCGIVTDRDVVVRGIAEGRDPAHTSLAEICSRGLTTIPPSVSVVVAMRLMKAKALRRLPVVEDARPVGIVSLGDLAVKHDPHSVLGEISAAPPNR
jgi:CBS domain-containing protein